MEVWDRTRNELQVYLIKSGTCLQLPVPPGRHNSNRGGAVADGHRYGARKDNETLLSTKQSTESGPTHQTDTETP